MPRYLIALMLVFSCIVSGTFAATFVQQERQTKKVKRVKRPTFTERDWDGIYFEDLFKDGLVGERPKQITPNSPGSDGQSTSQTADSGDDEIEGGAFAWSKLIGRSTIEDEVKAIQARLAADITTPVKFKSDYAKVHQSYSVLSMIFGIVREYDSDVRWKEFADVAQASFEKAAANSRVGTIQAYESCKRRKEDLNEMVRGGNFPGDEKAPEELDWANVVDRSPIMERLQESQDQLKKLTANKGDFTREITTVLHESQMVAAMATVLTRENMTDADDDGYLEFAKAMNKSALAIAQACENSDYDAAAKAANVVGQSCSNCHDEWR